MAGTDAPCRSILTERRAPTLLDATAFETGARVLQIAEPRLNTIMNSNLRKTFLSFALTACCISVLTAQQKQEPPRFESYSADVYAGKPAPLNLRSIP